jgi:rhodanese-related sulfurtransferase
VSTQPTSVEDLLAAARARLERLTPAQVHAAMRDGALLVDIRAAEHRMIDGLIPGARVVARNVLEWRLDPGCEYRDPELSQPGARIVLLCQEGCQSSLTAATVRSFGVDATDVIGGFCAWRAAGLPIAALDAARGRVGERDPHQIADREHADHVFALDHREMPEAAVHHQGRGVLGALVGFDRVRVGRHPIAHDRVVPEPPRDRAQHVALGHDPGQAVAVEYEHGADLAGDHPLRHLRERERGLDGQQVA